jgi:hypothetical protein
VLLVLWVYGNGLIVVLMRHEVTQLLKITLGEDSRISRRHGHAKVKERKRRSRGDVATPVGLCAKSCPKREKISEKRRRFTKRHCAWGRGRGDQSRCKIVILTDRRR